MAQKSTRQAWHDGEVYLSRFGCHGTYEAWQQEDCPDLLQEARRQIDQVLAGHAPLPFDEDTRRELHRIRTRAGKLAA